MFRYLPLAGVAVLCALPLPSVSPTTPHVNSVAANQPLTGLVIGIDPGHNGRNYTDPAYLNHQVWNGREYEDCDTTGTETNGGYTEPKFTWHVARYLRDQLQALGATVVMTRHSNHGKGPCVDERAHILNHANSVVAIDIHGDGGPSSGRGFAILEPVRDKQNQHVIKSSERFGRILRTMMLRHTSMPVSTYDGTNGVAHRSDLAGLNLAKEPKVLIECGNMRNATDARKLTSAAFQQRLARTFVDAIRQFLS